MKRCGIRKRSRQRLSSRAKQAAFAALLSMSATVASAQSSFPELPTQPNPVSVADARVESQLLSILGFTASRPANQTTLKPVLPSTPCGVTTANGQTPSCSGVVTAAATAGPNEDLQVAVAEESESLIDIDIPGPATTAPTVPLPPVISSDAAVPALPLPSSAAPLPHTAPPAQTMPALPVMPQQLALPTQPVMPAQPATTEPAATTSPSDQTTGNRAPTVVRRGRTMRMSIQPPAVSPPAITTAQAGKSSASSSELMLPRIATGSESSPQVASSDDNTFRLSDQPGTESTQPPKSSGNVNVATETSRPAGMRVRIEGEPAMVISNRPASASVAKTPRPTFEPSVDRQQTPITERSSVSSRSPITALTSRASKAVPAMLASRVTAVPEKSSRSAPSQTVVGQALSIGRQESTSIITTQAILEFASEHPDVCQVIRTGDTTLSVIGLSRGNTRIAVVTSDEQGGRHVEIRDVQVGSHGSTPVGLKRLSAEISQTIDQLYPNSQVEIVSSGDKLIVQGIVSSERNARKILSLVRKTALTPVVDRLQAYER